MRFGEALKPGGRAPIREDAPPPAAPPVRRLSRLEWTVALGLAVAVGAMASVSVVAYGSVRRLVATEGAVRHTREVLVALEDLSGRIKDANRGERGYIITGDPAFLAPFHAAAGALPGDLARVGRLTADNPRQQRHVRGLRALSGAALAEMGSVVGLRRTRGFEAARAEVARGTINALMDAADAAIRAMEREEHTLLRVRSARAGRGAARAMVFVGATSGLGITLLLGAALLIFHDVRERRRAERALRRSRERFRRLVETTGSAVVALSPDLRVTEFNRDAERISGVSREEALGRPLGALFGAPPGFDTFTRVLERALRGVDTKEFDAPLTSRRGEQHVLLWNVDRLPDANSRANGVIAVGREITVRKRMEEALRHQAFHDPLTGLPNRALFLDRLGQALAARRARGRPCAVLFLDLDRFKDVNDTPRATPSATGCWWRWPRGCAGPLRAGGHPGAAGRRRVRGAAGGGRTGAGEAARRGRAHCRRAGRAASSSTGARSA